MSVGIDQMELSDTGCADARFLADSLLKATLDTLPIGIVLVDADSRIVHSNSTAARMLGVGEPIWSCHGQLRATCAMTSATLMGAARQIAQNKGPPPTTGLAVALPYRDGRAAVAHVRLLDFGDLCRRSGTAAIIFITQAAEHAPPPVDALMTLFNLTWSEARVLEQIVSGRNRKEAAAVLGVADSTVKTHLDNIYAKTGTSDQLGLCRLAAKLSWPICFSCDEANIRIAALEFRNAVDPGKGSETDLSVMRDTSPCGAIERRARHPVGHPHQIVLSRGPIGEKHIETLRIARHPPR